MQDEGPLGVFEQGGLKIRRVDVEWFQYLFAKIAEPIVVNEPLAGTLKPLNWRVKRLVAKPVTFSLRTSKTTTRQSF
ncbi:MAG: hypothetical protein ABJJ92_17120 [Tateyamaria sp.]|uniref:hypothetical protein n=1 Tax=Tateyamaria sp. TaxID=1929288 RepID=UPI00329CEC2E